jgi:hypothetical protein
VLVSDGDDSHSIAIDPIDDVVRKASQNQPPMWRGHDRTDTRMPPAQFHNLIELQNEVSAETGLFTFVTFDGAPQFVSSSAVKRNLHP